MTTSIPTIPGFPAGWRAIRFAQDTEKPRDAVVLAENTDREHLRFVCWRVNMVEGGCFYGVYDDRDGGKAHASFSHRKGDLRC